MAEKIEFLLTAKNAASRVFAEVEKSLGDLGKAMGAFGAITAAAAGAAVLIGGRLASSADKLQETTRLLNVSAQTLREWQFVASRTAGITEDQLNSSLTKLTQKAGEASRGNAELLKVFGALGISQAQLRGELSEIETLYPRVIQQIGRLGSEYEQVALAQKLFEESGVRVVGVARTSADETAALTDRYREFAGTLTDEGVAALADSKRALESWAQIIEDRAIGAVGGLIIKLEELGSEFSRLRRSDEMARLKADIDSLETYIAESKERSGVSNFFLEMLGIKGRLDEDEARDLIREKRNRLEEIAAEIAAENKRDEPGAKPEVIGAIVDPALEAQVEAARRAGAEIIALDRLRTESERIQNAERLRLAIEDSEQRAAVLRALTEAENIERERKRKLQEDADKAERLAKAQHYLGLLAGMTSYNKAFFGIAKIAAIANAIISTRQAAAQALKDLPYPLNLAAAAAVVAAGFAQVASIQQTQFGQTAASVQGSGAGGFASGPSPLPAPAVAVPPGQQQQSTVEIVIRGGDSFGRAIVDALDVEVQQRDVVFIKAGSRQAAELAGG